MDLSQLADMHLGIDDGVDLSNSGTFTKRLHDLVLSETNTTPLASTVFWQACIGSLDWSQRLRYFGASPLAAARGQMYVVCHGETNQMFPQYDLVLFDPGLRQEEIRTGEIATNDRTLRTGWQRYVDTLRQRSGDSAALMDIILRYGLNSELAVEACRDRKFKILITSEPQLQFNSTPVPPLDVDCVGTRSTAGVVATNDQGITGVTAALHAIPPNTKTINVGHLTGTLVSSDVITDSAFIEVPGIQGAGVQPTKGPLVGLTPRAYETASFNRIPSGVTYTKITGWSPDLPIVMPGSQLKVLTTANTNPGDSGAALLDQQGNVLGFSFARTGIGSVPEFSAWIWAESVYQAHNIT